jgi:hypothetical protein
MNSWFKLCWASCVVLGMGIPGCHETMVPSTGWGMTDLPDTYPPKEAVFEAAREVIQQRYPMSSASAEHGQVFALTPVTMDGTYKSRKQISVLALRNFTGAYEPVVRVRQLVEVAQPPLKSDPESGNLVQAKPLAFNKWQALDFLPFEEQEIYDAILAKLSKDRPAPGS